MDTEAQGADASQDLRELLKLYADLGVDAPLGDEPVDRFTAPVAKAAPQPAPTVASAPVQDAEPPIVEAPKPEPLPSLPAAAIEKSAPMPAKPPSASTLGALEEARQLAKAATSLEDLRDALLGFDGCDLKKTARRMVFSDGNSEAPIMLIGEAPGRDEDTQGKPFVGRSGQLLDRMLASIGLDRTGVYIGNVIYWRPPGNRTPTPDERAICEPFIRRQIALAAPKLIMTLGGSALSTLFKTREGIMKTRGRTLTYDADGLDVPSIPTLHPAALLRNPLNKRLAWRDLIALQKQREALGLIEPFRGGA